MLHAAREKSQIDETCDVKLANEVTIYILHSNYGIGNKFQWSC